MVSDEKSCLQRHNFKLLYFRKKSCWIKTKMGLNRSVSKRGMVVKLILVNKVFKINVTTDYFFMGSISWIINFFINIRQIFITLNCDNYSFPWNYCYNIITENIKIVKVWRLKLQLKIFFLMLTCVLHFETK